MSNGATFPKPIRLLPRPGHDVGDRQSQDPFIRLTSEAHPLRAYLASLEIDGRIVVPHLTVLMESNEYPGASASGVRSAIGNGQVERIWSSGLFRHRVLDSKSIANMDERALPAEGLDEDIPKHPPLAWCRKTSSYVTPLCPQCLGVMGTCRDEVLLRRSGLLSYANSLVRFLYCSDCSSNEKRSSVFYTYSLRKFDGVAAGVQLRRRSELYRDLGSRISSTESMMNESTQSTSAHPCFECEHRSTCYPAGRHLNDRIPAEELLFPLAYYDFHWLPLEPLPLDFYETAALLGGASLADLASIQTENQSDLPLRQDVLQELDRAGHQFFFAGDRTGLFPLESLFLKLSTLAGLAQGPRDLLKATGLSHLALTPDRLRGHLSLGSSNLPARWGLSLKIEDLITTAPLIELEPDHVPGEPDVASFPYPCPEAYLPEGMSRPQIENIRMRMSIEDLSTGTTGNERTLTLRARLVAPDLYRGAEHGNHDLVRVVLVIGSASNERLVFSGRKTELITGGFLFTGSTGPLSSDVCTILDTTEIPAAGSAEVTVAHVYGAPADIMSLGLVMLKLLLSNDHQDTNHVDAGVAGTMAQAVAGDLDTQDNGERSRLHEAFRMERISSSPMEVLHRDVDRTATEAAIPSGLWDDTLLLALRMASNLPGWSICSAQDDYDFDNPAGPLQVVVQELEELAVRARGALIGSAGRSASVQEVCDDFLSDLQEASQPQSPITAGDPLDQTMVMPPEGM